MMKRGEITAFLSLIFVLFVGFIGSVLESVSIQTAKNYRRVDMDRAMQSVFAEYQRELLGTYDIFALDGEYETGGFEFDNIVSRLEYYEAVGMTQELKRMALLTDGGGKQFKEQAVRYMKNKLGVEQAEELLGMSDRWKEQNEQGEAYEEVDNQTTQELEDSLQDGEVSLPGGGSPLENISNIKKSNLLNVVAQNPEQLSVKKMGLDTSVSHRERQKGMGTFSVCQDTEGALSTLFFHQYLLEHFGNAVTPNEDGSLSYELEYLLAGKESDRDNLEQVVKKLLLIRSGGNYVYLLTDGIKQAEAEAMAAALCAVVGLPVLTEAVKQALLAAWAFGEAVMDVRALLQGKRTALLKTGETWQLQLSGLKKLGTAEDDRECMDVEGGVEYKDYLRMLLLIQREEDYTMRALDVMEWEIRRILQADTFRIDSCITKMEIASRCSIRRGVEYEFTTCYGYQ